jgi:tellurite resistance protein
VTSPGINKVANAARMVRDVRYDLSEAEAFLQLAIRQALAGGHRAADIAEAASMSRTRVYQIRDGRR